MFGDHSNNSKKFDTGKIRDVVTEVKYGTSKPAEDNGRYPYLRMNNITIDGYMDFSNLKYINLEVNEIEKYIVKKGDILFNRTNSKELVGKTGVFNESSEMAIAGYLIRIRTNEKANPWFIWGYLNSLHGKKTLFSMCKSIVGMANINAQELQEIKILIPPMELQTKFANIVEKVEALKRQYQQSLTELQNMYGVLSQKAFKGELSLKSKQLFLQDK
jgi:type I restriction enzyme S subunit